MIWGMENKDVQGHGGSTRRAFLSASAVTAVAAPLLSGTALAETDPALGHPASDPGLLNFPSAAPGADDDGSGVAVVLELARLFATRQFPGTLVFATVAGEEQGLYGSTFLARQLKAAGADVQGMFSNDIVGASQAWD